LHEKYWIEQGHSCAKHHGDRERASQLGIADFYLEILLHINLIIVFLKNLFSFLIILREASIFASFEYRAKINEPFN
jgi:hypothetical protein